MLFNGAGGEQVDLSANGNRLRFFRTQGAITMDTAGVERVDFTALGGADLVVNDLSGTDVTDVRLDLAATLGGATGDGQADRVVVNGTDGKDAITVSGERAGVTVSGLQALLAIQHQEPTDQLGVNGLAGDDAIDASGLAAGAISLALDGGAGNDRLVGGAGAESLVGGDGDDVIDGNGGADTGPMGAGDDTFVWDPGDGSDVVEGQDGADTMLFNGAGGGEQVDLSANGNRLRFFRTQGAITMDTAGVERVDFTALGGADLVTVNDLSGTDVTDVRLDLAATLGGATGDGQADRIVVNGTDARGRHQRPGDAEVLEGGLAASISILHPEAANDRLEINTLAGRDAVDSLASPPGRSSSSSTASPSQRALRHPTIHRRSLDETIDDCRRRRRCGSGARRMRRGRTAATRPRRRSRATTPPPCRWRNSGTRAASWWTRPERPSTQPTRKRIAASSARAPAPPSGSR